MKTVFLVTTRIVVEDPLALYDQARRACERDAVRVHDGVEIRWEPTEQDIIEIIGTREEPKLDDCLMVLMALDPENIEGCEVDESQIHDAGPKLVSSRP
jgi:hypothetical protein